uniref:Uncharacterized protein n=1 Tax=Panagrellus redivivus TaxID=6233 RepID=A0A7E4VIE4_PANRE
MTSAIVNLLKTVKIRTKDHEVVVVTGNVINECEFLKNIIEAHIHPEVNEISVPFKSAGLRNTLKFLEFHDLNKPFAPGFDYAAFLQENKPVMAFLNDLCFDDVVDMKDVIEYLQCRRLLACLRMHTLITSKKRSNFQQYIKRFKFMEIFTSGHETIKVPRNIVEESELLLYYARTFGHMPQDRRIEFNSRAYHKAIKALNMCDLGTPHVPLEFSADASITPSMSAFAQANQPVMNYFNSLMQLDLYEIYTVFSEISIRRLADLYRVYVQTLDEDRRERLFRSRLAIYKYFRHVEGFEDDDEDAEEYVMPAEGA